MTNKSIQIAHVKFLKDLSWISIALVFSNSIRKLSKSILKEHSNSSKLKATHSINALFEHQHQSLHWDTHKI